jgi:plastocyanin
MKVIRDPAFSPGGYCPTWLPCKNRRPRNLTTAIGVLGLFMCLANSISAATTTTIFVVDFDFVSSLGGAHANPTINVGDDVHWVWSAANIAPHSTTAAAGQLESWDSGLHTAPFAFDHVFTQAGTFNYFCLLHGFDAGGGNVGGMSGQITVVPEPAMGGLLGTGFAVWGMLRRRS